MGTLPSMDDLPSKYSIPGIHRSNPTLILEARLFETETNKKNQVGASATGVPALGRRWLLA